MTKRKVIEDSDDEENGEPTPPRPSATGLSDVTLSTIVSIESSPLYEIEDQAADLHTSSTELLIREARAAHKSLIEPTPRSTLPPIKIYSSSQQQTPTSPTTSRLKTKRSKTSVEKPKVKKPVKMYGKSSQNMFEFHGGSDGELDFTRSILDSGHKVGKRVRHGNSQSAKTVSSQASHDGDLTRMPTSSSGGDTELEPKPYEISPVVEKDVSLQSSMPPPASKFTSLEHSQQSDINTMPTTVDITPSTSTKSCILPPAETSDTQTCSEDRIPTLTGSSRGNVDDEFPQDFVQSGNLHPLSLNAETRAVDPQSTVEPALPSSSASEISSSKMTTIKRKNQTGRISQELGLHVDDEHLSTMKNPVVLLPVLAEIDGVYDELSPSFPETPSEPIKPAKGSKRKRTNEDCPVDDFGSDDNGTGIPKERYKPRPSKRRSGDGNGEVFIPTDYSKKPEAIGKVKLKNRRLKTTAFQELLPNAEVEDEEIRVIPDPRFKIPDKKSSRISIGPGEADLDMKDSADKLRAEAQPEPKPAIKETGQKKRGRPKKVVTNLSDETIVDDAEADHGQRDAGSEEPVISATAKHCRKTANTKEIQEPFMEDQDHNKDTVPPARDDPEDLPASIFSETHGNIVASKPTASPLPETSLMKANSPPETPRKSTTPASKGPEKHSPISSGKVAYRVGLSKRARIAPLLKIVRK